MDFQLSIATAEDIDLLSSHREKMWLEIHIDSDERVKETADLTREWIKAKLSQGQLIGFIVKDEEGTIAGSGCIWTREETPRPSYPHTVVPYLMSMYTERGFRQKGVAKMIVEAATKWCRENGYERILLHASDAGRPLYEGLGFKATREMRLTL